MQFSQQDFIGLLSGIIADTGVDPRTMILEITESMIMENVDAAVETMKRLRAMGVQLHIDDFGTGHSSLSYLQLFPVTALKIDRSFINKLTAKGDNQEIITYIVSLAESLNIDVIAEGVEMEHQLANVQNLNCDYGQGYLFARPMAFQAIDGWMQEHKYHA
jgi:EAL domain-containing protein (putative c-di-GMP-specific phosphodiesterase class I)